MGRHSASYIAAQQGQSAGPTQAGAAKYVGGVGAVALSLWAGAAIAASGVANADDTGSAPDATGPVRSALHSITGALRHGLTDGAAADGTSGVKVPKQGLFAPPKLSNDAGNLLTGPLRGLAGRDPHQLATKDLAAKPDSQRIDPSSDGLGQAGPVVGAVSDALRGGTKPFQATADSIDATPPATLRGFAPAAANQFAPASVPAASSAFLTALGISPLTNSGGLPVVPAASNLLGALQLLRRDSELTSFAQPLSLTTIGSLFNPTPTPDPSTLNNYPSGESTTTSPPAAGDVESTAYGDIGKWMLKSNGSVSNYGGQTYDGKTMVEPVNVIIVDPTSKTPEEARAKLNKAMFLSGFPSQPIHSGGFKGLIGTTVYGQKPIIPINAYSDNLFILDNDHGRIFGPAPLPGPDGGYVWTGAFSSETLGVSENGIPGHTYVSSNAARDALALRMLASGQVQSIDFVPMNNAVPADDPNYTSGDHDGYAVVITLK